MRRLAIAAIIVAVVSIAVSGAALWRTSDSSSSNINPEDEETTTTTFAPGAVLVPNVVGTNESAARAQLMSAGLRSTTVGSPSETIAAGFVTAQNPVSGTPLPRNAVVQLRVSTGPPADADSAGAA